MTHPSIQDLYDLTGKTALVTGGARNLGLDMATALASGKPAGYKCPGCATELVETHYVPGEPLLIDICPSCKGVFLDSGELPRVESLAAHHGGVNKIFNTVKALEKKGYMILGSG